MVQAGHLNLHRVRQVSWVAGGRLFSSGLVCNCVAFVGGIT